MKKITRQEGIAVVVGIGLVTFLLYGGLFLDFFNSNNNEDTFRMEQLPESGIKTEDIVQGTGKTAVKGDTLTVHYVGSLPGGKIFDSSVDRNSPFVFTLGQGDVIKGWEEGFVGMKEGGVRRIIVAPDYGYGSQDLGVIPPESTLVFEVQLLRVEKLGEEE